MVTFSRPGVQSIVPVAGVGEEQVLDAAASAELRSEHPLGKAIVAYVRARGGIIQEPERFDYTPGRGIAAQVDGATVLVGNTALMNERGVAAPSSLTHEKVAASDVFMARAGQILGVIAVADTVRPEAKEAIDALNSMSVRTVLLTGDSRGVAEVVAAKLDVKEVVAEALPEEKLERIKISVKNDRRTVCHGRRGRERCPGPGRGERRRRDGVRDGCGAGKRGRRSAWQRSGPFRGDAANGPTGSTDNLAELCRHARCRCARHRPCRFWHARAFARSLYPCHLGIDVHSQLRAVVAAKPHPGSAKGSVGDSLIRWRSAALRLLRPY